MSDAPSPVRNAYLAARTARKRLFGTIDHIQERLTPESLREDALKSMQDQVNEWVDQGRAWARANPGIVAAIVSAIGLYVAHRLWPQGDDETATETVSLDEKPALPATEGSKP